MRLCRFGLARVETRLEREPDALGQGGGGFGDHGVAWMDDLDGVLAPSEAVASEVALLLTQRSQPLHGSNVMRRSGRWIQATLAQ